MAVIKSGAIGDVLMSTPFLRALRKRFPNARIDYWTGRWSKEVLIGNPNLNKVFDFDDGTMFRKNIFKIVELTRRIKKEKYDLAFVLDKHYLAGLFSYFCKIPLRIGFNRFGEGFANNLNVSYGSLKHEIEYYLDLAYLVGARKESTKMDLFLSKADLKFANDFIKNNGLENKKIIGVAPGGAKNPGQSLPSKRWPIENYVELIKNLIEKNKIILFGGRGDENAADHVIKRIKSKNIKNAISAGTIKQSAALMEKCKFIVCNDTGPMHIAAALGIPTISIFGPTDPRRLAPIGKLHTHIWHKIDFGLSGIYGKYTNEQNENIKNVKVKDVLSLISSFNK